MSGNRSDAEVAQRILQVRRQRNYLLGCDLFGEPAWEMLLHLFVMQEDGSTATVDSLTKHAGVQKPTALRWLAAMESTGRIRLQNGQVRLSDQSLKGLRAVLSGCAEAFARS